MVCCGFILIAICIIGGLLVALKIYNKLSMGIYKGNERLDGKTVIVTGANAGIGLESAKDFAQRGARVIMVCRDMKKAERAMANIIKETGNTNIVLKHVDFSSLDTVRSCAKEILVEENKIDILLNNAGAVVVGRRYTPDGLDVLMQSNHFGPFLFTNMLLDKIKKSAPSRIVSVSSHGHKFAKVDFDNFKMPKAMSDFRTYCLSKLANIYFTKELAKKLQGTGVTVNCLHPGVFASEISRDGGFLIRDGWSTFVSIFFKSLKEGAQTSIYACLSPEVSNITGEYFADCKIYKTCPTVGDMGIAKKVWEISEDAVKLQPNEKHY